MSNSALPPVDLQPTDPSDRLNSWKEIAAFLGKGVRTAQRWEEELGLPIHRMGHEGGEIVFAFKAEILRWQASVERMHRNGGRKGATSDAGPHQSETAAAGAGAAAGNAPASGPGPAHRGARYAALAALAVATTVGVAGWLLTRPGTTAVTRTEASGQAQPTHWRVENDRLKVFDDQMRPLWERHFPEGVGNADYSSGRRQDASVAVTDLDGDDAREVLFLQRGSSRDARRLHVFNGDGSLRFLHHPAASVRFGETSYGPPWLGHFLNVLRSPSGAPRIWVAFIHGLWFPTVLHQLDARGVVLSEYWSNGYVTFVGRAVREGRPVLLVGATNNETRGASLAVFEGDRATGSAPAANPRYRCVDCPKGRPTAFLVFPRLCMPRSDDGQAFVEEAWFDGQDQLVVTVTHATAPLPGRPPLTADVVYTLGPDLTPRRVQFTREYHRVHSAYERTGRVDHAFGEEDRQALFPLLRWEGERFVELPPAPIVE